jgi:hypothetical protein
MEPISPELCLVDPVLAREARTRLPELPLPPAVAVAPEPVPPPRRAVGDRIARAGAWILVPSLLLNVALLKSSSPPGPSFATPAVTVPLPAVAATGAKPAKRRADPPARRRPPRAHGVLGAKATPKPRPAARPPVARTTLEWPATAGATSYDLVLWRGHRRVADLWPKKPAMSVAAVACGGRRHLEKGRYLWFVYPVVDAGGGRRYGKLARWGVVEVDPKTCAGA